MSPSSQQQFPDPFTIEIVSHRLHAISREIALTLERVGGTVNTAQMKDYIAALYRADGSLLSAGEQANFHIFCAGMAVRAVAERFDGGVSDGDMFLLNDPYIAAIHQSDLYLISPIFADGRRVAWSATFVHVMDVGAMSPGGNSPGAREVEHEGLRLGPLRIVEHGVLREDVLDALVELTRQPDMVSLDLRCQMAANFVARDRFAELYATYGTALMEAIFDFNHRRHREILEERLSSLPDSEHRREIRLPVTREEQTRIACTLRKVGNRISFDFTDSSDQSSVGINLPRQATFGSCAEAVFHTLAHDLYKNEGLFEPIEVLTRPGSVVACEYPAPVSLNTTSGGAAARFLAHDLMARLLATSERWREEVYTGSLGGRVARHAGTSQHGTYYVSTLFPSGGGGARLSKDGVNCTGPLSTHNVEWLEQNFPLLQLFRRQRTDSAGPGRMRGGVGEISAYVIHNARDEKLRIVSFGALGELNSGHGLFGGLPGSPSKLVLARKEGPRCGGRTCRTFTPSRA